MTECEHCGREDGHYLGCAQVAPAADSVCGRADCEDPVREWSGRGAKPKYCTPHSVSKRES